MNSSRSRLQGRPSLRPQLTLGSRTVPATSVVAERRVATARRPPTPNAQIADGINVRAPFCESPAAFARVVLAHLLGLREASRPRGPPKAYVTALEDRIERFERLFKRLRPEADFTNVLGPPIPRGSWRNNGDSDTPGPSNSPDAPWPSSQRSSSRQPAYIPSNSSILPRYERVSPSEDSIPSDDGLSLSEWPPSRLPAQRESRLPAVPTEDPLMQEYLSVNEEGSSIRFHGKSSFFSSCASSTSLYAR
ncbi:hypothetical protein EW145_g6715 [Phellinidium pouzarii]|uniref:Uncharacterized protein n=1 Tax=Phellinidium pouzarii TaxID=167371 RepID=A0A4V3XBQ0_9AGAM|nr:hypothetical protein EW145_g6715 [Phellinidium pouzarii]